MSLPGARVLALASGRAATPLVSDARARGLRVIDGHAFLLEQALLQFALLTGLQPPRGVMESALDAIRGAA
jgi:shikimate 5-dehydrogenase